MFTKRVKLTACGLFIALSTGANADTLKEIYEQAVMNDPVLRSANASFLANKEDETIARSTLLPQIGLSGSYTTSDSDFSNRQVFVLEGQQLESVSEGSRESDTTAWSISLSQTIFNLSTWYRFQASKSLTGVAEARFASAQQDLIIRVNEAYFNVLRAADNLESRLAEERAIKRQLEQTRERFQVGLLPITDVHESQAAYDDAAVNTLDARGLLSIAFEALETLTGKSHDVLAGLSDKFDAARPTPDDSDAWVDFALENNYALKIASFAKDASEKSSAAAKAARLPTLSGSVSYNDSSSDGKSLGLPSENNSDGYSATLSVSMPIWLGGSVDAQRRKSYQQYIAASEDFVSAKRTTVQAARSYYQVAITNAARVKARKQAITSAESALEATQAGYDVGTRNIVDVLQAQRALYGARRNYDNTRYDYILSLLRLKQVAGQLSPEDVYSLNAWVVPSEPVTKQAAEETSEQEPDSAE